MRRAIAAVFNRRRRNAQFDDSAAERPRRRCPRTRATNGSKCVLAIAFSRAGDTVGIIIALDLSPLPAEKRRRALHSRGGKSRWPLRWTKNRIGIYSDRTLRDLMYRFEPGTVANWPKHESRGSADLPRVFPER